MSRELEIAERRSIDRERWDEAVDASDEAWLWHRFDLLEALAEWPNRRDLSFAVVAGGALAAIVPLQLLERRGGRLFLSQQLQSLGGPARAPSAAVEPRDLSRFVHAHVLDLAERHGAAAIRVSWSPLAPAHRSGDRTGATLLAAGHGWRERSGRAWIIPLRANPEELWQRMEGRARTAVRKAERAGVSVRCAERAGDVDAYYELHRETYHRTGAPPHPRRYFELLWERFIRRGLGRAFFAEHAGRIVGAATFGTYKSASVYWTGASSRAGLALGANPLLQWRGIQAMVDLGVDRHETGEAFPEAADEKLKRLHLFKKSFGGEMESFREAVWERRSARSWLFSRAGAAWKRLERSWLGQAAREGPRSDG